MPDKRQTLRATWFIAQRDLLDFWRGRMLVAMFFLMPILLMAMFGYMYPNVPKANAVEGTIPTAFPNLRLGLVRSDDSSLAYTFEGDFADIARSQNLFQIFEYPDYGTAREGIVRGDLSGVLEIPFGFGSCVSSGRQSAVELTVDQTDSQVAAAVQGEVTTIVGLVSAHMSASIVNRMMGDKVDPGFVSQPVYVSMVPLITGSATTFQFLAPGFMGLVVVLGTLNGVGNAIAKERDQGTMDGLMVCPISMSAVIAGKTLAQTVRGLIQAIMVLLISMTVFGVRIYGNPFVMLEALFLGVMSFVGVGIILSTLAPDQETVQMMMSLLQMPMMFLSGVIFPISQLPGWLQMVGKSLPLYYAADALRRIIVLNAGLDVVGQDFTILILYALVTMGIAIITFRKTMAK